MMVWKEDCLVDALIECSKEQSAEENKRVAESEKERMYGCRGKKEREQESIE